MIFNSDKKNNLNKTKIHKIIILPFKSAFSIGRKPISFKYIITKW